MKKKYFIIEQIKKYPKCPALSEFYILNDSLRYEEIGNFSCEASNEVGVGRTAIEITGSFRRAGHLGCSVLQFSSKS